MDQAADIYISRCDGAPCGEPKICLFKGANSAPNEDLRNDILVYIKGTRSQKKALRQNKQSRWTFLENIWGVRNRHVISDLPSQCVLLLRCCMESDCPHPICKQGTELAPWFMDGPTLQYFPLPIPDLSCPWCRRNCSRCPGEICYGNFLMPEMTLLSSATPMTRPPSQILKDAI